MRRCAEDLLAVLLPSPCPVCDRLRDEPLSGGVCLWCWSLVEYLVGPVCPRCGRIHPGPQDEDLDGLPCGGCRARRPPFDAGVSMAWYRGSLRSILRLLKFGGRPELARPLARRAHAFLSARPAGGPAAEVVVPVPLPLFRRIRRGYNQSAEVSRQLARLLGIPGAAGALGRRLGGRPQAGLRAADRDANVRGAFFARRSWQVNGRSVLLLDDVWTTGATLRECARVLRRQGARRVIAFSLARVPEDFDDAPSAAL